MRFLYTAGIRLYTLGVRVAALCGHAKARQMVRGWKHWQEALLRLDPQRPTVWFHASSLGEFEQARPVLEAYRQRQPGHQVLLTFFSPSGYEVRRGYAQAEAVCYLPPDTPRNARLLVEQARPVAAYFVKYDFWFNTLGALRRRGVPTYLFSAIFRPGQYFFKPWGRWFRRQLRQCFTRIFVQNDESLALLRGCGVTQCTKAGDTRFDRVHQIALAAEADPVVERFLEGGADRVLVGGSTWPPDERLLAAVRQGGADWFPSRIILAPHVIAEEHLRQIEALFPDSVRYSALKSHEAPLGPEAPRVLIVDNIGLLSKLYRYARVAYIGGGFGVGIHNILEAVAFGKPVVFGPNYGKFQEARDIIAVGGGFSVRTEADLAQGPFRELFARAEAHRKASEACRAYMQQGLGSTAIILDNSIGG